MKQTLSRVQRIPIVKKMTGVLFFPPAAPFSSLSSTTSTVDFVKLTEVNQNVKRHTFFLKKAVKTSY